MAILQFFLTGNNNANPNFVNALELNFALQYNSPCIDAGNPDTEPDPDGTIADIGCSRLSSYCRFYNSEGPFLVGQPLQFINNSIGHIPRKLRYSALNGNPSFQHL